MMFVLAGSILVSLIGFYECADCQAGTWGTSCGKRCGNCLEKTVCNRFTGLCPSGCKPGYQGPRCNIECRPKTYWQKNICKACGECIGMCDNMTGVCPSLCNNGWTGNRCDQASTKTECTESYRASHQVKIIQSPHKLGGETCRYKLQRYYSGSIYVRIHFHAVDPKTDYGCSRGSVLVVDVQGRILGRYCNRNSKLIKSEGRFLIIEFSGSPFNFKILYSTYPFDELEPVIPDVYDGPTLKKSSLGTWGTILVIAIPLLVLLVVCGCCLYEYWTCCQTVVVASSSSFRERTVNTGHTRRRTAISHTVNPAYEPDRYVNPAYEPDRYVNPAYESDPPPYWSVFASATQASVKNTDDPPSYDVATGSAHPS